MKCIVRNVLQVQVNHISATGTKMKTTQHGNNVPVTETKRITSDILYPLFNG